MSNLKMKVGIIYSGGKDSTLAMIKSMDKNEIACLISIIPFSEESLIFHFSNVEFVKYQAEAMDIPLIQEKAENENELETLKHLIEKAKKEFKIEGIVCGAIKSKYQYERLKKLSKDLNLEFLAPLWQMGEIEELKEVLANKIKAMITCVAAYPLTENYLGRIIDEKFVEEMKMMKEKYGINASGEGGEYETFVLDAPIFKKEIVVKSFEKSYKNYFGVLRFKEVELLSKS